MRFLSFVAEHSPRFGALVEGRVVDLGARMSEYASLKEVLTAGALVRAQDIAAEASADFELKEIAFRAPVIDPGRIVSIHGNYPGDQEAETRSWPRLCLRTSESLVGHRQRLVRPLESLQLDYAGGLALVIGRRGRRIPTDHALGHVAGLTVANDGFVRDWPVKEGASLTQGRNFAATGSVGPCLVTLDELPEPADLTIETRVNRETRQRDQVGRMLIGLTSLVSHVSTFMTLEPGDLILTGTPAGTGADQAPPEFLAEGDLVEVEVSGVGTLVNEVSRERESADEEGK